MRFSHRFILLLSLLLASLPLYAQRVTEEEIRTRHRLRYRQLYTLAGVIRAAKAMHIFICAFCQGT